MFPTVPTTGKACNALSNLPAKWEALFYSEMHFQATIKKPKDTSLGKPKAPHFCLSGPWDSPSFVTSMKRSRHSQKSGTNNLRLENSLAVSPLWPRCGWNNGRNRAEWMDLLPSPFWFQTCRQPLVPSLSLCSIIASRLGLMTLWI